MVCVTEHTLVGNIETFLVLLLISLFLLHIHLNILQMVYMFHPISDLLRPDSLLLLSSIKVKILNVTIPQTLLMTALLIE